MSTPTAPATAATATAVTATAAAPTSTSTAVSKTARVAASQQAVLSTIAESTDGISGERFTLRLH